MMITAENSRPPQPVVWIIDSEQWPRACLRAELIERGFDAVGFLEIPDAVRAFLLPETRKPQLIVLELRGQNLKRRPLKALAEISVPIVALGGAAELNEPSVVEIPWLAVMKRPFTLGAVADLVAKTLRPRHR